MKSSASGKVSKKPAKIFRSTGLRGIFGKLNTRNLKVTARLYLLIIPALVALVAFLVFFILRSISISQDSKKALYDEVYVNSVAIFNADRDIQQAAFAEQEVVLNRQSLTADVKTKLINTYNANTAEARNSVNGAFESIMKNDYLYDGAADSATGKTLKELNDSFQTDFSKWQNDYIPSTQAGDYNTKLTDYDAVRSDLTIMTGMLDNYAKMRSSEIHAQVVGSIVASAIVISAVILLILGFSVILMTQLKNNIKYVTNISKRIAGGELAVEIDQKKITRDEIGQLCEATGQILDRLNGYIVYIHEIADVLNTMAQGDMRVRLQNDYAGEFASIKEALLGISSSLNRTLSTIAVSAEQVDAGSDQVASGAQALSQGATQQAGTIEELSAGITEISAGVKQNATNVRTATEFVEQAAGGVDESNAYMQQMLEAMTKINDSSREIGKIIKVIDSIAFQTNILALNAAVEAARAGAAGRGFAVVADEVRNLATKSADAAKQTTDLINSSMGAVSDGFKTAEKTAKSLQDVTAKSEKVKDIIEEIDIASSEQALAIAQIMQAVEQISAVVQTNSATAEQEAAASEELSSQSHLLKEELGRFILEE